MSVLIQPSVMRQQPQQIAPIDWSNSIAQGLIGVIVGSLQYDPFSGKPLVNSTPANRSIGSMGSGVDGRQGQAYTNLPSSITTNVGSIFVVAMSTDSQTEQIVAELGPASAFSDGTRGIRINAGKIGTYTRNLVEVASPNQYVANTTVAIGSNYNGTNMSLYIDGALVNSGATISNTVQAAIFNVGGITTQSTQYYLRGPVYIGFAFNRQLSDAEHAKLAKNPWQLFKSPARKLSAAYIAVANGSANVTGATATPATGTIASIGNSSATVTGAQVASIAGLISASGAATSSATGTSASGQLGIVAASASARALINGAPASAQAGITLPSGSANSPANGVAATGQPGIVSATGSTSAPGSVSVTGVAASALPGIVSANASGNASANLLGTAALSSAGIVSSSASASASTSGSAAAASTGLVSATANGNATVAVLGVAASSGAGVLSTSGSARASVGTPIDQGGAATTSGVSAFAMVGVLLGSVSARTNIAGVGATAATGTMTATGVIDGNVSAYLTGLVAATTVGMIAATGTRTKITVDITEDMLCKVVRDYIMSIAKGMRVVRTPVNKASMPDGAYVAFTPGTRSPLSTNVGNYMSDSRSVMRAEQMRFQIDCYGEGARDLAEILNTLFRDQYACDQFSASGLNIAPLYAGDIMQMPFVNDADQYEERYTFEIFLQVNSIIITAQQSCNMLGINILSVDANFPPV